jgi:hypothetical protein
MAIIAASVLVIAIAALAWKASVRRVPVYAGKTVEAWLGEVFTTNQSKAMTVLKGVGPEAMPALVQAFKKKDSAWDQFYGRIFRKFPAFVQKRLSPPVPAQVLWGSAELALLNNRNGRNVLPELVGLLKEKDVGARKYIMGAVVHWARPGDLQFVPALTACLRDPDPNVRNKAAHALDRIAPKPTMDISEVARKGYHSHELEREQGSASQTEIAPQAAVKK